MLSSAPPAEAPDLIGETSARARALLKPPLRLPLSQWIETRMHLPDGLTAKPGLVKLWKFQRAIADAMTDPAIERVTVRKCVRVGYSTLLAGLIASHIDNDPAPIGLVLPTEKDCADFVKSDLEPIFDATPGMEERLRPAEPPPQRGRRTRRRKARSTMLFRQFAGGSLKVIPGRSPRNMRKHTIKILAIDEEDGFEVTKEGDAIDLAIKRTLSFPDRKIIRGSTPADLATSTVCRDFAESDQRIFEILCPLCLRLSEPVWADIRWDKELDADGKVVRHLPETAHWRCPKCEERVDERFKAEAVEQGDFRTTRPEVKGHAGFALNVLASPHPKAAWAILAKEYLEVYKDPERLRTFHNTMLGLPWAESLDAADPQALAGRAELFGLDAEHESVVLRIPRAVLVLTAGVDVQGDRLEITIWGFDRAGVPYALGHFVIFGSPVDDQTWADLDALLQTRWSHPLGGTIGIDATCVDSSDGNFVDEVYAFCWARSRRRVMAIKGMGGTRPSIEASKGKVNRGKINAKGRLWIVGTDTIKTALQARLDKKLVGAARFSVTLTAAWFEQLTSEPPVIKRIGGRPVRKFERIKGLAAEALDCTVYAWAARRALTHLNLDEREASLAGVAMPDATPRTPRQQAEALRRGSPAPARPARRGPAAGGPAGRAIAARAGRDEPPRRGGRAVAHAGALGADRGAAGRQGSDVMDQPSPARRERDRPAVTRPAPRPEPPRTTREISGPPRDPFPNRVTR